MENSHELVSDPLMISRDIYFNASRLLPSRGGFPTPITGFLRNTATFDLHQVQRLRKSSWAEMRRYFSGSVTFKSQHQDEFASAQTEAQSGSGEGRHSCHNSLFVQQRCIHVLSHQATAGSLCRAKRCLIGFRSISTPPEARFPLLCQQHLECGWRLRPR